MTELYIQLVLMDLLSNGNTNPKLKIKNGNAGNGLFPMLSTLPAFMNEALNHF